MLSKLLKYEIKATQRIFLPLFIALLLFAAVTKFISGLGSQKWDAPAVISMVIYIALMVGMFAMSFIMMIQRFYKNLLSDEGYLMLTLPVKSWRHIVSKLLTSMMWVVASILAALLSILIVAAQKGDLTEFLNGLASFFRQLFSDLGISAFILSFEVLAGIFINLASGILIIYASITLGHLFRQHKILASFGAFIALSTLSKIFFTLMSSFFGRVYFTNNNFTFRDFISAVPAIETGGAFLILISAIMSAVYFVITNYILSKKLNLE